MFETQPHLPIKRTRVESDPKSERDKNGEMDFRQDQHMTTTQAIGNAAAMPAFNSPQMPLPLSPEHAAMRADFELITASVMEELYRRITADINASVTENTAALLRTNSELRQQITVLNSRITQIQQQLLVRERHTPPTSNTPPTAPAKKILKKTLTKKATGGDTASTATATGNATATVVSAMPQVPPNNTRGWQTVPPKPRKTKATPPKLIPTNYPQAEREVICHFQNGNKDNTNGIRPEKTYNERQTMADAALRWVNSAIIDNKDVLAPPFIRARVTVHGNIIFTTSTTQSNIIYEDYTTIIADARSYYSPYEKVEIDR